MKTHLAILTLVFSLIFVSHHALATSKPVPIAQPNSTNITIPDSNPKAMLEQAIELYEQNNIEQAKQQFITLAEQPETQLTSQQYLIQIMIDNKQYDDAEEAIEQLIKQFNPQAKTHFFAGIDYSKLAMNGGIFSAMGFAKNSLKHFKQAVALEPQNTDYLQALMSYYLAAPSFVGGDKSLALTIAKQINHLDKLKGLQSLAQMYSATDNQTAFNELVANAEKEIISHPEVQLQLGFIFQGKHQYQQAIEAFEQTITNIQRIADFKKQQLVYFQALYQLGKSYDEAKTSPEKGIKALTQYIEQAPDRPKKLASKDWAQYRLANLYQQLGNKTQAQSLYQKVFATTTNNELKEKVKKLI